MLRDALIRIPNPDLDFLPFPYPGSRGQKAADPGSRSATLVITKQARYFRTVLAKKNVNTVSRSLLASSLLCINCTVVFLMSYRILLSNFIVQSIQLVFLCRRVLFQSLRGMNIIKWITPAYQLMFAQSVAQVSIIF
jgi:hypothetical protein